MGLPYDKSNFDSSASNWPQLRRSCQNFTCKSFTVARNGSSSVVNKKREVTQPSFWNKYASEEVVGSSSTIYLNEDTVNR